MKWELPRLLLEHYVMWLVHKAKMSMRLPPDGRASKILEVCIIWCKCWIQAAVRVLGLHLYLLDLQAPVLQLHLSLRGGQVAWGPRYHAAVGRTPAPLKLSPKSRPSFRAAKWTLGRRLACPNKRQQPLLSWHMETERGSRTQSAVGPRSEYKYVWTGEGKSYCTVR